MKPPNLPPEHDFSRSSLWQSFRYAGNGLRVLLSTQRNARIHLVLSIVVIALGGWFRLPYTEWALLALAMGLVWVAEGLNTALELLTDLVSPEPHPLAGQAKDVAAAAVLLSTIFAAVAGGCVFLPRLWACWS
jgi:diacylglycerol kinase